MKNNKNNKIQRVYIIGFSQMFRESIEAQLLNNTQCDIFLFKNKEALKNYKYSCSADIYILGEENFDLFSQYSQKCKKEKIKGSFLFLVESDHYIKYERNPIFNTEISNYIIFDFLRINFTPEEFLSKINLLFKINTQQKKLNKIELKSTLSDAIWEGLYSSDFYIIICDNNLNIKLINSKLMHDLQISKRMDIIGKSIMNFIHPCYKEDVEYACNTILDVRNSSHTELYTSLKLNNKIITVKWYNSYINKGNHYILCMGIPMKSHIRKEDDLDTIRDHYRNLILHDKIKIKNMKKDTESLIDSFNFLNIQDENLQLIEGDV